MKMNNRIRSTILLSALLVLLLCYDGAIAVTRQQVVDNAKPYCNYIWSVITTNPRYPIYADSGKHVVGEAYSYGNKETPTDFGSFITNLELIPRNWEENWIAHIDTRDDYTGIDCSGLVTRCWGFSEYNVGMTNAKGLYAYTIPVNGSAKAGDIWWYTTHVVIQSEDEYSVYEANPEALWDEIDWTGNRVQYHENRHEAYQKRSIFPQFSGISPKPDTTIEQSRTITIQLQAEGTKPVNAPSRRVTAEISNIQMWLDGNIVSHTASGPKNRQTIKYKVDSLDPGKHRVKVQCDNVVNGIAYMDTVAWEFQYGTKPGIYSCTHNATVISGFYPLESANVLLDTTHDYCYTVRSFVMETSGDYVWSGVFKDVKGLGNFHMNSVEVASPLYYYSGCSHIDPGYGYMNTYYNMSSWPSIKVEVDSKTLPVTYDYTSSYGPGLKNINWGDYRSCRDPQKITVTITPAKYTEMNKPCDTCGTPGIRVGSYFMFQTRAYGNNVWSVIVANDWDGNRLYYCGPSVKNNDDSEIRELHNSDNKNVDSMPVRVFNLMQNHPNPFKDKTTITCEISTANRVSFNLKNAQYATKNLPKHCKY